MIRKWTVWRAADAMLSAICAIMAAFGHGWWQAAWLASAAFCAASAWWCWADRLNAAMKKWLVRTALGAALRLR